MQTSEHLSLPEKRRNLCSPSVRRGFRYSLLMVVFVASLLSVAAGTAVPVEAEQRSGAVSVNDCFVYYPTLYQGVEGQADCVAALQWFLQHSNSNTGIDIDGKFGPQTANHVIWFKASEGLPATAVVNADVWTEMVVWCADNDWDVCTIKVVY